MYGFSLIQGNLSLLLRLLKKKNLIFMVFEL